MWTGWNANRSLRKSQIFFYPLICNFTDISCPFKDNAPKLLLISVPGLKARKTNEMTTLLTKTLFLWWLEYGKCTQRVNSQSYLWTALHSDGHGGLGLWQGQTDGNSRSQRLDSRGRSLYRHHLLLTQHCRSTARVGSYWHLKWFSPLSLTFQCDCVMYVWIISHLLSIII